MAERRASQGGIAPARRSLHGAAPQQQQQQQQQSACTEEGCTCTGFEQIGKLPRCSKCFHPRESHTVVASPRPAQLVNKEVTRLNSTGRPLPSAPSPHVQTPHPPPKSPPRREQSLAASAPTVQRAQQQQQQLPLRREKSKPLPSHPVTSPQPPRPAKPLPRAPSSTSVAAAAAEPAARRDQVARELLTTERTFVESLQLCIEEFLLPLRKADPPIVSGEKLAVIFSNIAEVLQTNTVLLEGLEARMAAWGPRQLLGDLFSQLAPFLKIYTSYVANFETASTVLEACEKQPAFDAFLKERMADPKCRGLSLRAFLILPVQRIPRYRLLLEDLVKSTDPSHPDFESLAASLETIKNVADQINDAIKKQENRQKIVSIQQRINSIMSNLTLVEAHRLFIREGVLFKQCRKAQKKRLFFLFNDMMMYASLLPTNGLIVHRVIPLGELRVADIPDTEELKNAFQVGTVKKSFVVVADNVEEKYDWLRDITEAANELKQRNLSLHRASQQVSEANEAPVWQPDSAAKACFICKTEFTLINRKHHCRACGRVVCSDCSKNRVRLQMDPSPQRICTKCFEKLQQQQQAPSQRALAHTHTSSRERKEKKEPSTFYFPPCFSPLPSHAPGQWTMAAVIMPPMNMHAVTMGELRARALLPVRPCPLVQPPPMRPPKTMRTPPRKLRSGENPDAAPNALPLESTARKLPSMALSTNATWLQLPRPDIAPTKYGLRATRSGKTLCRALPTTVTYARDAPSVSPAVSSSGICSRPTPMPASHGGHAYESAPTAPTSTANSVRHGTAISNATTTAPKTAATTTAPVAKGTPSSASNVGRANIPALSRPLGCSTRGSNSAKSSAPTTAPATASGAQRTPAPTCARTVPGHAPARAMPAPRSSPPSAEANAPRQPLNAHLRPLATRNDPCGWTRESSAKESAEDAAAARNILSMKKADSVICPTMCAGSQTWPFCRKNPNSAPHATDPTIPTENPGAFGAVPFSRSRSGSFAILRFVCEKKLETKTALDRAFFKSQLTSEKISGSLVLGERARATQQPSRARKKQELVPVRGKGKKGTQ